MHETIPSVAFYEGTTDIRTPGGVLTATSSGAVDLVNGEFTELFTITSGAGRFAAVLGRWVQTGRIDFAAGTVTSQYTGRMCFSAND